MKEHEKLGQEQVSEVTLHFVLGHFARKQTVKYVFLSVSIPGYPLETDLISGQPVEGYSPVEVEEPPSLNSLFWESAFFSRISKSRLTSGIFMSQTFKKAILISSFRLTRIFKTFTIVRKVIKTSIEVTGVV